MKRTIIHICVVCIVAGTLFVLNCNTGKEEEITVSDTAVTQYRRIVSLSPSTTEILFELGLGDRVVGVTRFCTYPPEAREKTEVGGYVDPNYEAITVLNPDLVLVLPGHEQVRAFLTELELHHVTVHNETIEEILETITTIGQLCGVEADAQRLVDDITSRMQHIQDMIPKETYHPRLLISIGRTLGTGSLKEVYVAGPNTFYDELVTAAGGRNAYDSSNIRYPAVSAEGLLHINPDIIVEMAVGLEEQGLDEDSVRAEWATVSEIAAVKNGNIHILTDDYCVIPGPRFILLLEDMARLIQTERERLQSE